MRGEGRRCEGRDKKGAERRKCKGMIGVRGKVGR